MPPGSFSALNLASSTGTGKAETFIVGGTANSQPDPDLGTGQSFRYPLFGARAVRVNYKDATDSGKNKNANSLQQTMTVTAADVDPTDGQVHVRFAVAPILENPSHGFTQQPYYYVELTNLTRGTIIYHDFNVAGQSGVPWNTTTSVVTGNATQWLNWQLVDIAPGPSAIATGDQVKLTVVGSGCSLGGHFGRIYLDGIGPTVPGLYTWASGAQTASAGTNLTYTFFYSNGGTSAGIGTHVDFATPPQTTFVSASPGASCTAPAVGASGTVSCPLGTLGAGASGSFTITVKVATGATGSIVNGNYSIGAVNAATLLGAKVTTTIPSTTTTFADVSVSQVANRTVAGFGQTIQYTFKVANAGPTAVSSGLTVTDTMPAQLTGATWTCTRTAGSNGNTRCNTSSGSGNISVRPKLGSGGELTYTVSGTIASGSGLGSITHTVTTSSSTTTDPNTANNTSVLTLPIGTARTLSLTKSGAAGNGTLSSSPSGLSCGSSCSSATGTFADSASVVLTATPIGGASFRSWSGACTGSARTCTVTMNGDQSVTATFDPAPAVGAAAVVYAYAGSNQLARTSTAFATPIAALVTDANGNALSGVTVTFAGPGSGAGASFSSVTTTNAAGIATATATANATAGSYAVTASVQNIATPASFSLINVGPATRLVYLTGGNVSDPQQAPLNAAFSSNLMATATDAAGSPVPGASVSFAAPSSGATAALSAASATSDSNGRVQVGATANGVVGSYAVTATLSGATPVTFNLQNLSSSPSAVFVVGGSNQSTDLSTAFATPLSVVVADALGNAVPSVSVTYTVPSSGASATLNTTTVTTDATGQASVTATANASVGTYNVSAAVSGATPATFTLVNNGTQFIDVQSGSPQRATVGAGFGSSLVAVVTDVNGAAVSGVTVTFAAPASGARASLSAATAVTDASGLATMTATAGTVAGSYNVNASTPLAGGLASFALANDAGAATALTAVSGGGQTAIAGAAFAAPLVARVADANGNPVAGVTVSFAVPSSGATATLDSTTAVTDSTGLARVSPTAGALAGSYAVTASVSGIAGTASFTLINQAGAAAAITVDSGTPQSRTIGTAFAPIVAKVTDAGGNPVSGVTVAFAAPSSGASATVAATATTNASGLASVTPTANSTSGDYTVSATVSGVSGSADFALTNVAASPIAGIAVDSGTPQSVEVNTAFAPIVAKVTDGNGSGVAGVTVTFTAPGADPTATVDASAVTDALGLATVTPTAGSVPGTYTVSATVNGVSGSADFELTNLAATAVLSIAADDGTPQSTTVGTAFAPIVAKVTDGNGSPISGVLVAFSAPSSGATASVAATATTDNDGLASVIPTAGTVAGSYVVSATASGVTGKADFALTNVAGAAAVISASGGTPQSVPVDAPFAAITAKVTDSNGNPIAGKLVTFDAPSAGATATVTATAMTNGSGLASVTPTAGTVAGTYAITAKTAGVTGSASFALTNEPGPASAIEMVGGSPQDARVMTPFTLPLVAHVTDLHGNDVADVTVTFGVPPDGARATLSAATALTGPTGLAQITATANSVTGDYDVIASISGDSTKFALTNTAGAIATLTATGGGDQQAVVLDDFATKLAVHAVDGFGNVVPDAHIVFAGPPAGATASFPGDAITDEHGDAEITATAGSITGTYVVKAKNGSVTASYTLTNLPGAATKIAVLDGAPQQAIVDHAFADPLRVVVKDSEGNVVPRATVTFSAPSSLASAVLDAASADTDDDGIAAITASANTASGSYDVTARLAGGASTTLRLTNKADVPFTITAAVSATPQQMTILQPYAEPLAVAVRDRHRNPVPDATVSYTVPSSGASVSLSAATAVTDGSGVATVDATANERAGSFIVRAAVGGVTDPAAFALGNIAGPPRTLSIVRGDEQRVTVDTDLAALEVRVVDGSGNPVTSTVVSFSAPSDGATAVLAASSAQTDDTGVAKLAARTGTLAGGYTVKASLVGGASPVSFALTNLPGAAATITAALASTPQNAPVDRPFAHALVAQVVDAFTNPVPGVTVTFAASATPATGTLADTTVVTGDDGRVSTTITAGSIAGAYTVTATAPQVSKPARFALANLAGAAHTITASAGMDQSAVVGAQFSSSIAALVEDANGNPVPGVTVVFSVPSDGPTASPSDASATTDDDGIARTGLTCAHEAGEFSISATTDGAAAPAVFALTALPGAPMTATALASSSPQSIEVGHSFVHALVVTLADTYGNPVPGVRVTFAAPHAPGAQLSALTGTSDADGIASVLAIADSTAGTYDVTATVTAGLAADFVLTNTAAPPSSVLITGGGAQRTLATTEFAAPVTAHVVDAYGNPIAGVPVVFSAPTTGATATMANPTPVSDVHGDAAVTLAAGPVVGRFVLSAEVAGATAPTTTTLEVTAIPTTITASAPDSAPVNDGTDVTITVAAAIGTPDGTVEVVDADGTRLATAVLEHGAATLAVTGLTVGSHAVTARYAAQGSYAASASTTITFEATSDTGTISGAGCSATGGSGSLLLVALAALLLTRRKRGAIALAVVATVRIAAADPSGRAINRYHAASPDSAWFALDSATFAGERDVAIVLVSDYAREPLDIYDGDTVRARVVRDALVAQLGASVTLLDRLRLSAGAAMATWQHGSRSMYNGVRLPAPTYAFGDITLAGDVRVLGAPGDALRIAVGFRLTTPSGQRTSYMSDAALAGEPRVLVAGTRGRLEYAGNASAFLRRETMFAGLTFGSELRYGAAVGARLLDGALLVGPELFGATSIAGHAAVGTPLELQLGGHYAASSHVQIGVGAGLGVVNAVGEPHWRALLSLHWTP